jgi:hypothetical protein
LYEAEDRILAVECARWRLRRPPGGRVRINVIKLSSFGPGTFPSIAVTESRRQLEPVTPGRVVVRAAASGAGDTCSRYLTTVKAASGQLPDKIKALTAQAASHENSRRDRGEARRYGVRRQKQIDSLRSKMKLSRGPPISSAKQRNALSADLGKNKINAVLEASPLMSANDLPVPVCGGAAVLFAGF